MEGQKHCVDCKPAVCVFPHLSNQGLIDIMNAMLAERLHACLAAPSSILAA